MVTKVTPDVEMAETETEWIWAVTWSEKIKKGKPVFPFAKKTIFKHWVDMGWVTEKEKPHEQMDIFDLVEG